MKSNDYYFHSFSKRRIICALTVASLLTFTVPGIADGPEDGTMRKMDHAALDTDKDGFLSRHEGESSSFIKQNFDKYDMNLDGKIDPAEFSSIENDVRRKTGNVSVSKEFAQLDTDSNGKLTRTELSKNVEILGDFDEMDSNKDGHIEHDEASHFDSRRKQDVGH